MFKIIKKIAQRNKTKKKSNMKRPLTQAEKIERAESIKAAKGMKATKKRKKLFKLSPEQKEKINKAIQKGAGEILKYSQGKPKITVKPAAKPKAAELNFFDKSYNLGLFEATGKQITIGGSVLLLGGIALSRLNK